MATTRKIATGAILGTLLGSLAVMLYPRRDEIIDVLRDSSTGFTEKAKDYADVLLNGGRELSRRRIVERVTPYKYGFLGMMLGAGAALFLAPKSGRQLRTQVSKAYNELSGHTEHVIDMIKHNSHNPFAVNGIKKTAKRRVMTKAKR